MKKALSFFLFCIILCCSLAGCQGNPASNTPIEPSNLHGVRVDTSLLSTNTNLTVEYTASDSDISLFLDVLSPDYLSYEVYTVSATENGNAVKPAAPVSITFPLPIRFHAEDHLVIIYNVDSNGDFIEIPFTAANGMITVSAADFGRFVLVLRPADGSISNDYNISEDIKQILPALNRMLTNGLPPLDMTQLTPQAALTFLYYAERINWGYDATTNPNISVPLDVLQRYAVKWFGVEYDFQFPTSFAGAEVTLNGDMVSFEFLGEPNSSPLVMFTGYQSDDSLIYQALLFEPQIVSKQPEGIPELDYWVGDQPGTFITKGDPHTLTIKNMNGYWQLVSFA